MEPGELDLLNVNLYKRNALFFFPMDAFLGGNRGEASKQFMAFEHASLMDFNNRFNACFLTPINRKNKRTHDTCADDVTPFNFTRFDQLSSAGLCNQLIESFVIDYCCQNNLCVSGHALNLTHEYRNQLSFYQTSCFAPFRRSTKIYYVDELVARKSLEAMLQQSIGLPEDANHEDLEPYIDLYTRLEQEFQFRKSRTVARLIREYRRLGVPRDHRPGRVTLDSVRWSTVGQLNFFRWFIGGGGMSLLLAHRCDAVKYLEDKRQRSIATKHRRRLMGYVRRQRTVVRRPRQCLVSNVVVDCVQAVRI